jgi:hypothetical protein
MGAHSTYRQAGRDDYTDFSVFRPDCDQRASSAERDPLRLEDQDGLVEAGRNLRRSVAGTAAVDDCRYRLERTLCFELREKLRIVRQGGA